MASHSVKKHVRELSPPSRPVSVVRVQLKPTRKVAKPSTAFKRKNEVSDSQLGAPFLFTFTRDLAEVLPPPSGQTPASDTTPKSTANNIDAPLHTIDADLEEILVNKPTSGKVDVHVFFASNFAHTV